MATSMNICRLCLSEGIGYPSIFKAMSPVQKLVASMETAVGIKFYEVDTWPTHICPECMAEAAGVVNFTDRVRRTQLTIEARYGKRPESPLAEIPIVEGVDLLVSDNGKDVYEIQYIDEEPEGENETDTKNLQVIGVPHDKDVDTKRIETETEEDEERNSSPDQVPQKASPERQSRRRKRPARVTESESPSCSPSPSRAKREKTHDTSFDATEINALLLDFGVLTCKSCPKEEQFKDFRTMKAHNIKEHNIGGVSCCEKFFSSRVRLFEHVKYHVSPEGIECDVCHKKFKTKANLKVHKDDHHAEEEFKCTSCDFVTGSVKVLKRHELSHIPLDERDVSCDLCDFKCNFASQLSTHKKAKHSEEKEAHVCEICGKNFSTKGNLTNHHKSLHDPEAKKATCTQCGKSVRRLSRHLTICQQKLNLKCPHCGSVHQNMHALRTHVSRMHTEAKSKWACNLCGKVLSRESHLKEHMATHTKTALYHCQFCEKEFYNSSNMHKHLKSKHDEEYSKLRENETKKKS